MDSSRIVTGEALQFRDPKAQQLVERIYKLVDFLSNPITALMTEYRPLAWIRDHSGLFKEARDVFVGKKVRVRKACTRVSSFF